MIKAQKLRRGLWWLTQPHPVPITPITVFSREVNYTVVYPPVGPHWLITKSCPKIWDITLLGGRLRFPILLGIQGNPTVKPFAIASSSGSTILQVLQNGYVGIGTTNPTTLFYVNGTTTSQNLVLPNITSSILAVDASGHVIATTTSAGGVSSVSGSGSIISSGGSTPTIQLQNLTSSDILFGAGTNTIATSSLFTFSAGAGLTVNATSTLATTTITNLTVSGLATISSLNVTGNIQATGNINCSFGSLCGVDPTDSSQIVLNEEVYT